MKNYAGRITRWFSPRFLAWLRTFVLFFAVYTLLALLLQRTIAYTLPFLIGLGIALLSQPLIRLLSNRLGIKESVASWVSPLCTILVLLGAIGSLGFLGVRELVTLVSRIPTIDPQAILASVETWIGSVETWLASYQFPITLPSLDMDFLNANRDTILKALSSGLEYTGKAAGIAVTIVTSLPTWLMLIIVILFSAFSFTKDFAKLKRYGNSLFSPQALESGRKTWANGLVMLGNYIRSYLLIYFLTFLQSYILFLVLKIEYPLVWSVLVGVSDLIPILGPGTIYIPMAIARVVAGDWVTGIMLVGGWLFITVVRQFVESKVVADSINIHPLFMLAVLFIAFQAGSVALLVYLTFLIVFYNLLKQSGILHPLFDAPMAGEVKKRAGLFHRRRAPSGRPSPDGTAADSTVPGSAAADGTKTDSTVLDGTAADSGAGDETEPPNSMTTATLTEVPPAQLADRGRNGRKNRSNGSFKEE